MFLIQFSSTKVGGEEGQRLSLSTAVQMATYCGARFMTVMNMFYVVRRALSTKTTSAVAPVISILIVNSLVNGATHMFLLRLRNVLRAP